jgi:NitT/TauT family transport system permease protein
MKDFFSHRKLNIICSIIALAIVVIVWVIAYNFVQNDLIVPSLSDTLKEILRCVKGKGFWRSFGATCLRTVYAFLISFALAIITGAVGKVFKPFGLVMSCFITVFRTLPTLAITLILLIWTSSSVAPIIVTCLILYPMIYSQFNAATDGISDDIKEMAKVYKLTKRQKLFKIYLPQVAPNLLNQVGADISLGLKVMVSAEVLSYTLYSMGYLMQYYSVRNVATLAALTVICIAAGLLIELVCYNLKFITAKWRVKDGRIDN